MSQREPGQPGKTAPNFTMVRRSIPNTSSAEPSAEPSAAPARNSSPGRYREPASYLSMTPEFRMPSQNTGAPAPNFSMVRRPNPEASAAGEPVQQGKTASNFSMTPEFRMPSQNTGALAPNFSMVRRPNHGASASEASAALEVVSARNLSPGRSGEHNLARQLEERLTLARSQEASLMQQLAANQKLIETTQQQQQQLQQEQEKLAAHQARRRERRKLEEQKQQQPPVSQQSSTSTPTSSLFTSTSPLPPTAPAPPPPPPPTTTTTLPLRTPTPERRLSQGALAGPPSPLQKLFSDLRGTHTLKKTGSQLLLSPEEQLALQNQQREQERARIEQERQAALALMTPEQRTFQLELDRIQADKQKKELEAKQRLLDAKQPGQYERVQRPDGTFTFVKKTQEKYLKYKNKYINLKNQIQ